MKKEEMVYGERGPNKTRKERLSHGEFADPNKIYAGDTIKVKL